MNILIGNIIALIGSILMVYSGTIKHKKKILYVQTIQICLFIISNLVLGGITGAIINGIGCIRNILCYHEKLGLKEKIILSLASIILSLYFNNLGIIGLLPLISTVVYIFLMNIKNVKKFKMLVIFTMIMWLVYDLFIKSYTSALFDFMTIITNMVVILKMKKKRVRK